eukprot:scaffold11685_cov99-Ochromonas_danica.AAC.1
MRRWYEWLISRNVLMVEMFPVQLSVFAKFNLAAELDYGSYCPYIRSIEFVYCFNADPLNSKGVRYTGDGENDVGRDLTFSTLIRGLKVNALKRIRIELFMSTLSYTVVNMIRQLLANHLSSIRDLEFSLRDISEESVDEIVSILYDKTTPLKELCLRVDRISFQTLSRYLSSVAKHLELEFYGLGRNQAYDQVPMRKALELYESCPNLITFVIDGCSTEALVSIE